MSQDDREADRALSLVKQFLACIPPGTSGVVIMTAVSELVSTVCKHYGISPHRVMDCINETEGDGEEKN